MQISELITHTMRLNEDVYYDIKYHAIKNDYKITDFMILLVKKGLEKFKEEQGDCSEF